MVHLDSYLWSCIFLVFSPTKNRPLHEGEVVPKFSCPGLSQRKAAQYFYYMTLTVYARVVTGGDGVGGSLFFLRNINCCWFQMSIWKDSRIKEPLVLGTWKNWNQIPAGSGYLKIMQNKLTACSSYFKILEDLRGFGSSIFQNITAGFGYLKRSRIKEPLVLGVWKRKAESKNHCFPH
jgi:hypothetical protein